MNKQDEEAVKRIARLIADFNNDPDNPSNISVAKQLKIERFILSEIKRAREGVLEEAIALIQTHTEHNGSYCDAGYDMDWYCRSECVEMAVNRLKTLSQQGESEGV